MTDSDLATLFPDGIFARLGLAVAFGLPEGGGCKGDPTRAARAVMTGLPIALAIWSLSFLVLPLS